MAQEIQYADPDQVWTIWFKDGKKTNFEFTNKRKLTEHADKFPEIFEAVLGADGIYNKCRDYVESQGQEGEKEPEVTVGEYIVGVRYRDKDDTYSISRKPKSSGGRGGYKPAPVFTLLQIVQGTVPNINKILEHQRDGEIYRFSSTSVDSEGYETATVLRLKQVN